MPLLDGIKNIYCLVVIGLKYIDFELRHRLFPVEYLSSHFEGMHTFVRIYFALFYFMTKLRIDFFHRQILPMSCFTAYSMPYFVQNVYLYDVLQTYVCVTEIQNVDVLQICIMYI